MNKSMIKELFYGKRGFYENIRLGKEYRKIIDKIIKLEEVITKNFDEEQKKAYFDYCVLQGGLESESGEAHYIEGFKIGLRLGIECMEDQSESE